MLHRDSIILSKISSEIAIALDMISGITFKDFDANEMLKRAVCMTVINIGELVKSLSPDIRQKYNTIPWREIAGFRDIAAHKYQTLHMEDVYKTVIDDFPVLADNLRKIK